MFSRNKAFTVERVIVLKSLFAVESQSLFPLTPEIKIVDATLNLDKNLVPKLLACFRHYLVSTKAKAKAKAKVKLQFLMLKLYNLFSL
jgi:hypothetical protein